MLFLLSCVASAFLIAFIVMPVLINVLTRRQILDIGGRRKIHKGFVPSMGGIAIFIGFAFSTMVWMPYAELAYYRYFCGAMLILFVTGMRDDLAPLSPRGKLVMQLMAAFLVAWGGGNDEGIRITSFYGFMGIHELPLVVSYLLSIFFIIVVTNAFNLIDGLDGLAGLIGLIAFTILAGWFLLVRDTHNHSWAMGLLLVGFIGGIVGFLCYNWHPASIFMGDTGSLLLGFVLSVGAIKFLQLNGSESLISDLKLGAPLSMAAAIAFIPLFDTGRIFLLRISQGRSPFSPDKLHVHHLLMRVGLKHSQVALIMGGAYLALVGVVFVLSHMLSDNLLIPILIATGVGLHFLLSYVVDSVFDKRRDKVQDYVAALNSGR
ncbi:MAG: undecaprenyl/decaprenyl-phosphate alpha-N-acetylglucosaminyl 1-phosphate transferase [Prevotellaceae bacterium]|jgi:UDP-N-acetylmuramyl pentapeptide phosphotransferase/UDP-N-acetylglucosamine-1-phosphate transferase|nr:undecaprenyl/decaprenyl-phosphate alpha-N-acetylglucosaminyl 1-phosphate transferase [Prevotellaceae bacterium]